MSNRQKNSQFRPGKSGNPRGRPKKDVTLTQVQKLAREHSAEAMKRLIELSKQQAHDGASMNAVRAACNDILDHANRRLVTDAPPGTITIEDILRDATAALHEQMKAAQTPPQFAALLKASLTILREEERLKADLKGLPAAELDRQIAQAEAKESA